MIEELKRFIMVANRGNVTRSAEELFITQSALSQSLDRLEKDIGAALFQQKGKYLSLTSDGQAVLPIAEKIVRLWDAAKDSATRKSVKPVYTIGMFDNVASKAAKVLEQFIENRDFSIELIIDRSETLFTLLQLQVLDIAFCIYDEEKRLPLSLEMLGVFEEKLIPVSSKKFPQHISSIPFILYNKGSYTRNQVNSVFIKQGIEPVVFTESTSPMFMKELALLGCGVALLPENMVKREIEEHTLLVQSFPFSWKRTYGFFRNKHTILQKEHTLVQRLLEANVSFT